jgi:hypothetical protein
MANWTPEVFVGKLFQITAEMVPPPAGLPAPTLWGNEQLVRERVCQQNFEAHPNSAQRSF